MSLTKKTNFRVVIPVLDHPWIDTKRTQDSHEHFMNDHCNNIAKAIKRHLDVEDAHVESDEVCQSPRTDAFANELLAGPAQSARQRTNIEWIAFARRLERELRAAQKELAWLRPARDSLSADLKGVVMAREADLETLEKAQKELSALRTKIEAAGREFPAEVYE